jgi:hypothetical protein
VGRGGLEPPTPGFSVPLHDSTHLPCDASTYGDSERSRNGEAAQNPAHISEEVSLLTTLLAELPDDDRAELLDSIRTLIKFYRAGVTAESK